MRKVGFDKISLRLTDPSPNKAVPTATENTKLVPMDHSTIVVDVPLCVISVCYGECTIFCHQFAL